MVNIAVLAQGGRQQKTASDAAEPTTGALRALWAKVVRRAPYESTKEQQDATALFESAAPERAASGDVVVSLHEPIDEVRMEQTIAFIEQRMHKLLPRGKSREHDKVREVHEYLTGLRRRPKTVDYVYMGAIGRLYTSDTRGDVRSHSLQGCYSGLRARLIGHVGYDIDIANSLPTLTVQWIEKLVALGEGGFSDADITWLAHYVRNRSMWLEGLMAHYSCDRGAAKALLLTAMFGGEPKNHYRELGIKHRETYLPLEKVVGELGALRPKVIEYMSALPKYKDLYDFKLKQKDSAVAAERSVFALITQELEDCVMGIIRSYMDERGIQVFALIHDGFIAAECSDQLLRDIEARVAEYGWQIELAEKPLFGRQDEPVPELAPLYATDAAELAEAEAISEELVRDVIDSCIPEPCSPPACEAVLRRFTKSDIPAVKPIASPPGAPDWRCGTAGAYTYVPVTFDADDPEPEAHELRSGFAHVDDAPVAHTAVYVTDGEEDYYDTADDEDEPPAPIVEPRMPRERAPSAPKETASIPLNDYARHSSEDRARLKGDLWLGQFWDADDWARNDVRGVDEPPAAEPDAETLAEAEAVSAEFVRGVIDSCVSEYEADFTAPVRGYYAHSTIAWFMRGRRFRVPACSGLVWA
ncbi:hypothetical protein AB1Y20_014666 [Prymnesium parvum]